MSLYFGSHIGPIIYCMHLSTVHIRDKTTVVPRWLRPAVIYSVTTSWVRPCQHAVLTPFIISSGLEAYTHTQSHSSSVCQRSLSGTWSWISASLNAVPFSQQPSPAPPPISPSGWRGPAPCCCPDPRALWRGAADPCSSAPDTAPPSPRRQNTTPARNNETRGERCFSSNGLNYSFWTTMWESAEMNLSVHFIFILAQKWWKN